MSNVSFDGSPVQFRLDSPLVVCFDPLVLDLIRDRLASMSANAPLDLGRLLERLNADFPAMSCYQIADFQPGNYSLDPRDIRRFGDEEQDLDYNGAQEDEAEPADDAANYPFVGVDSGALIFADFAHLAKLVNLLSWEQYDLGLQTGSVFRRIADALGGHYFAVIIGGCMAGMEFDGDGTYTIEPDRIRLSRD